MFPSSAVRLTLPPARWGSTLQFMARYPRVPQTPARLWLALAFALTTGPLLRAAEPQPTTRPARLVVATFNINYGIGDAQGLKTVVELIRQTKADVVAIQEGNWAVYSAIRRGLAKEYPHMQFYPGRFATGSGWLSKHPLLNKRVLARRFGSFDTPLAEIRVGGRAIQLANLHLQPSLPDDDNADMVRIFAENERVRVKEVDYILSKLDAERPRLLLGDLNTISLLNTVMRLKEVGFIDSFAEAVPSPETHPTWWWNVDGRIHRARFDYVWHDGRFKARSARVVPEDVSDHYPVIVELELADRPAGSVAAEEQD